MRCRIGLALLLLVAACRSPDPMACFEPSEPIADADPAVRHDETVKLPTRLRVERDGDQLEYGVDEKSVVPVTLDVGRKMILGTRIVWTARRGDAEPEWLSEEEGSLDYGESISTSFCSVEDAPFVLEAAVEVFETDIPPHHFWTPERGRYRVLWRRTLRADVPAD
jgi:hypothetical protein